MDCCAAAGLGCGDKAGDRHVAKRRSLGRAPRNERAGRAHRLGLGAAKVAGARAHATGSIVEGADPAEQTPGAALRARRMSGADCDTTSINKAKRLGATQMQSRKKHRARSRAEPAEREVSPATSCTSQKRQGGDPRGPPGAPALGAATDHQVERDRGPITGPLIA